MNNQIIVGFPDEKGLKNPVFTAGPELSRDKLMKIWLTAKQDHKFPKGVVKLVLFDLAEADVAIFISDAVTAEQKAYSDAEEARLTEAADKKKAAAKLVTDIQSARKAVQDTAVARNAANTALNIAKQSGDKDKTTAAQSNFDAADRAWQEAKTTRETLENPPKQ